MRSPDFVRTARAAAVASVAAVAGSVWAASDAPVADEWLDLVNGSGEAVGEAVRGAFLPPAPPSEYRNLGPIHACFSKEMPPTKEMMDRVEKAMWDQFMSQDFDPRYNTTSRWTGSQGSPKALTWSFAPDGLNIPSGIGEGASANNIFATLDSAYVNQGGRATWISRFQAIFDRWHALTGLSYTRITVGGNDWDDGASWGSAGSATRGDVRISMHPIDGGGGVLAYNSFPQNGDMVMDSGDKNNWASTSNTNRFLRNTAAHEHGHGIGLLHTCSNNSGILMEPALNTSFDGPQQDDIRGGQRHYGDPNEPDDTAATAKLAGALGIGTITLGNIPAPNVNNAALLSIDANGEQDWHKFTTATPLIANVTLQPIGSTYDDSDQNGDGSCQNDEPDTNAKQIANLALEVYAANGTTVILSSTGAALGADEVITGILLSPPGNFYARVFESDAPTQSQLYKLILQGTLVPSMTASDGTFDSKVAISWSAVAGATSYQVFRNTSNDRASATSIGSTAATSMDDTTAVPLTVYFYWAEATQGGGGSRPLAGPETGFRAEPPPPPCPPDFNGDGFLTGDDLDEFVAAFEAGDPSADYDEDGFTTGDDYDKYIADFQAGC